MKHIGLLEIGDAVVPRSHIPEFVKRMKQIGVKRGIPILTYGHAGDGNVHLHPLGLDLDKADFESKLPLVFQDIYSAAIELGGAVSGEHGIGFDKKSYFKANMDENVIRTMAEIKKALDPNHILNPGKIFDI